MVSSFEVFWQAYPRRVGKKAALKAWEKIDPDDNLASQIVAAIHLQALGDQERRFIPHPATWLNQERWTDEVETTPPGGYGSTLAWQAHCPHQPPCLTMTSCPEAWAWVKQQVLASAWP